MKYAIAICLGHDAIIAAGSSFYAARLLAGLRLDEALVPLLADLPEYHAELADGCLSWVRCTAAVAAEYGIYGQRFTPAVMAEPFDAYPAFVAALPEECDWSHKYNGVIDLAVNVKGRRLPVQGLEAVYSAEVAK